MRSYCPANTPKFTFLFLVFGIILVPTLVQAATFTFEAFLNAGQVVAGGGSTSTATGFANFVFDTSGLTITTDLSWTGLSGPTDRAHIHDGPPGNLSGGEFINEVLFDILTGTTTNGSPEVPCPLAPCRDSTGWTHSVLSFTAANPLGCAALYANCNFTTVLNLAQTQGLYLDIHTELYPGGEIRGVLLAASTVPEPSSIWLLLSGGLVAVGVKKRMAADCAAAACVLFDNHSN